MSGRHPDWFGGGEAPVLKAVLDRARQELLSTALRSERQGAGLLAIPEWGEAHPREEGWPRVRFAPDFNTTEAMKAELRANGAVLGEIAGALRELEARLGSRPLLVEGEREPELEDAMADAASQVEAAARVCH